MPAGVIGPAAAALSGAEVRSALSGALPDALRSPRGASFMAHRRMAGWNVLAGQISRWAMTVWLDGWMVERLASSGYRLVRRWDGLMARRLGGWMAGRLDVWVAGRLSG